MSSRHEDEGSFKDEEKIESSLIHQRPSGPFTGGFTNTQADWWVAAYLNGVLYYGYYDDTTSSWQWTTQAVPAAQGGIVSISPTSVFSSPIPAGTSITFYFGVDFTMDGIFDSPDYIDYVTVIGD